MKIVHISDTHGLHGQLHDFPAADMIVHSGDISFAGSANEVKDFIDWFWGLDYKYKIFIAGNHDLYLDGKKQEIIQRFMPENCFYLYNSGVTIEGLKFWGIPFLVSDDANGLLPQMMAQIPTDTDILVTHQPPYGILDKTGGVHFGCPYLLLAVMTVSPRYHLFGHAHNACGTEKLSTTTFVNASVVNDHYQLSNRPFVFDL
jgi:predicted phosphodiesterase